MFTLVLRAKADAQLSSALSLNRILSAEAYNANNDQLDLAFKFNAAVVSNGFELKQNTPNPFNGETLISGAAQGTVFCFLKCTCDWKASLTHSYIKNVAYVFL